MTNVTAIKAPSAPAQLTNMRLALSTVMECQEAAEGLPRMGLFYGFSGYGKSVAAAFISARLGAPYLEAKSAWTVRSLLENLARELGITKPARTAPKLLEQIIESLIIEPRPLCIDEMDHLVRKSQVEIIRDIHDGARVPILMIGEEALPSKLKEWERFDNRILVATPAQPASLADAMILRDHYCTRAEVADDLVEAITAATKGVTRRIVVNLQAAQTIAINAGMGSIDRDFWGDRGFRDGTILARRQAA